MRLAEKKGVGIIIHFSTTETGMAGGVTAAILPPAISLTAELMRSHIRSQQPGGLTD